MANIRDSDTIPTEQDRQNAVEMFAGPDGELDLQKIANTVARVHRKESHHQKTMEEISTHVDSLGSCVDVLTKEFKQHRSESKLETSEIKTCLIGDALGQSKGLIAEHKIQGSKIDAQGVKIDEILNTVRGHDTTRKSHRPPVEAIEPKQDEFLIVAKAIIIKVIPWLVAVGAGIWGIFK